MRDERNDIQRSSIRKANANRNIYVSIYHYKMGMKCWGAEQEWKSSYT